MDIIGRWLVASYHNLRKLNFLFLHGVELCCLFTIFGNISSCAHRLTQSSSHLSLAFLIKQKIYLILISLVFFGDDEVRLISILTEISVNGLFVLESNQLNVVGNDDVKREWDRRRERDLHIVTPLLKSYSQALFVMQRKVLTGNGID